MKDHHTHSSRLISFLGVLITLAVISHMFVSVVIIGSVNKIKTSNMQKTELILSEMTTHHNG